jgi:hypothetical protein
MNTRDACILLVSTSSLFVSACTKADSTPPNLNDASGSKDVTADTTGGPTCISIADDLIANFTTDNGLNPADGRQGGFYVYGDPLGTFDPPVDKSKPYPIDTTTGNPACSGPGSFHTRATGFGQWGAALGTDFMPKTDAGGKGTYNASKYKGVSFWAKAATPLTRVQVSFPDIFTDAAADPTVLDPNAYQCVYQTGAPNNCSPYLVKLGDASFPPPYPDYQIGTEWKRFDILFADTKQDQYNPAGSLTGGTQIEVAHLTSMAIQVNANYVGTTASPNDFEIWIDDVNIIK